MVKFSNNISFFTFFTLLFVNNFNVLEVYSQISNSPSDTVYNCYITDVFIEEGEHFIKIKPIQFLWDLSAVIEAKKDRVAEYDIDKVTKDTNWYVPNDYHINYDSSITELTFRLIEKSKVLIYDRAVSKKISIDELRLDPSHFKLQLFDRYTHANSGKMDYYPYQVAVEDSKVTIIREIYVP
jgi:hypothetical protein